MATGGYGDGSGAGAGDFGSPKKKQRFGSRSCPYTQHVIGLSNENLTENPRKHLGSYSSHSPPFSAPHRFNDPAGADVILNIRVDSETLSLDPHVVSERISETQIYLHSGFLRRSKYFDALLSDRWQRQRDKPSSNDAENCPRINRINYVIPGDSMDNFVSVLKLLYSENLSISIDNVSTALDLLPIALELLFEDCVKACTNFIEAVPWSEDEEKRILSLIPLVSEEESKEILARISPSKNDSSEEMLQGLFLFSAIQSPPNMAFAKAFVAKLLRDFSSREIVRRVLGTAFEKSLKVVKQSLEEYLSPVIRGNNHDETEAIQRLHLHTAMTNFKHVSWLVERMIELRVADTALKAWTDQASLTADLRRTFLDDLWRSFFPGFPYVVLRCICRLANAVVTGNIVAATQVRIKFVRDWLPVLTVCKERVSVMGSNSTTLSLELEDIFLRIISTLPISDARELLQQCLSFSTRNIDDCPHLVAAFTTWFCRANRPPRITTVQARHGEEDQC